MAAITVKTNGQNLTVNASVSHWTTAALAVTASTSDDVESTTTTSINSDYTMHFSNTATTALITIKQVDGTTLYAATLDVSAGTGPRTLNPLPDPYHTAADSSLASGLWQAPAGALAQSMDRTVFMTNNASLSTGRMSMVAVGLPAGTTVSSVTWLSATTALSGGTAQWFALYNADRTLIGQTTDDTSTAWAANSFKTLSFAVPVTTTKAGLHYLAINVTASTVPTLLVGSSGALVYGAPPIVAGTSTTGLTTTAPATAAAITAGLPPYAYCS